MLKKLVPLVATLVAALGIVGVASANTFAYRDWYSDPTGTPTDWVGNRATVDNPSGSQRTIYAGDFFDTSVLAANGYFGNDGRAIQQGVTYEYQAPNNTCNKGSSSAAMYYFVETDNYTNYTCYYESNAATAEAHTQKVEKNSSGEWQAFLDGNYQGHQFSWTACGGNACYLQALGESLNAQHGYWQAKWSGSGNTPWQFNNGTLWSTIHNADEYNQTPYWSSPGGTFPDGLWWFTYSVCC
jgi:hypothetical protein